MHWAPTSGVWRRDVDSDMGAGYVDEATIVRLSVAFVATSDCGPSGFVGAMTGTMNEPVVFETHQVHLYFPAPHGD